MSQAEINEVECDGCGNVPDAGDHTEICDGCGKFYCSECWERHRRLLCEDVDQNA